MKAPNKKDADFRRTICKSQNHILTRAPSQGNCLELGDRFRFRPLYSGLSFILGRVSFLPGSLFVPSGSVCWMVGASAGAGCVSGVSQAGLSSKKGIKISRFLSPSPILLIFGKERKEEIN